MRIPHRVYTMNEKRTPQIAFLQLFNSKPHVGTADMGLGMRQLFIYTPW